MAPTSPHLGIANFTASDGRSTDLREGKTKTGKITDYWKKLKIITSVIYIMLMRPVYFSTYNLAKLHFRRFLSQVVQNLNSRLLCSSHAKLIILISCHLL
jgi:hypothetical protein